MSRSNRSKVTDAQWEIILGVMISHMDLRGGDSWGYYNEGNITKGIGTGSFGAELKDLSKMKTLMFHTRKATVGAIIQENAHPWRKLNIVGMHNGGVSNHFDMNKRYDRNFEVDSMHIFEHLATDLPLYELRAHGTIVFVDELYGKDVLWASKFNEGILTVVGIGEDKTQPTDIIFCSLPHPIKLGLDLAKVPYFFEFPFTPATELWHMKDGYLFRNDPAIKLTFSAKTNFNETRPEYDLRYTNWERRGRFSVVAEDENVSKVSVVVLPAKEESSANIKNFVRLRKGLEAFYGKKICCHCVTHPALVRVPCTERVYCHDCWVKFERMYPFLRSKDAQEMWINDNNTSQRSDYPRHPLLDGDSVREELEEENQEEDKLCDDCCELLAIWYHPARDEVLCDKCKQEQGLNSTDVVLFTDAHLLLKEQKAPVLSIFPEVIPPNTPCDIDCGNLARVNYLSLKHGKHVRVCFLCMNQLMKSDEQRRDRPIKIGLSRSPFDQLRTRYEEH